MRRNAVKDIAREQRRTTSDKTKSPHLAVDAHQFKEEELDTVGCYPKFDLAWPSNADINAHRPTRYSMVSKLLGTSSHQVEQSL